jgi:hypothetical protein
MSDILESHFKVISAFFITVLLLCAINIDFHKKMWVDELYTLHMALQPSLGEIVKATLEGCDGQPPLYAMIVHSILPWVQSEPLAVRLPSSLGFCLMASCLLAFCRRRLPALYSFIAALLLCNASLYYATEGRCYGLVLGCAAAALLCWQFAIDGRCRNAVIPLLAFFLALMTSLHYYSIFFVIPLFLAEMVRWRISRKLDFAILGAMSPMLLVLALHYPFIEAERQFQQHYWITASWGSPLNLFVYVETFVPLGLLMIFLRKPQNRLIARTSLTLAERLVISTLLLMPFCILSLSIYTTHIFVFRYVLWAEPGIAILIATMLYTVHIKGAVKLGILCLLVILLVFFETQNILAKPTLQEGEAVFQNLKSLPNSSEPIIIADHHVFMELSYYAPLPLRNRLIYPVSRDLDLHYFGFDTGALLISALSHRSNLYILDYNVMIATHPRFLLAALPKDYLPKYLADTGYSVTPVGSSPTLLYEVTKKEK